LQCITATTATTHYAYAHTALQVITQYLGVTGVKLPALYTVFLHRLSFVNFNMMWLLPVGCYVKIGFYGKLLLSTTAPVALVALLFTPRAAARVLSRCNRKLSTASQQRLGIGSSNDVRMLLVFTFWIFSSVSTTVLQTFACEHFSTGESFLRADYAVQCYTHKHKLYMVSVLTQCMHMPTVLDELHALLAQCTHALNYLLPLLL
jgi:hypothetical protein